MKRSGDQLSSSIDSRAPIPSWLAGRGNSGPDIRVQVQSLLKYHRMTRERSRGNKYLYGFSYRTGWLDPLQGKGTQLGEHIRCPFFSELFQCRYEERHQVLGNRQILHRDEWVEEREPIQVSRNRITLPGWSQGQMLPVEVEVFHTRKVR